MTAIGFGEPLERCFERSGLPSFDLPAALATQYGGPLGFGAPRVVANFVASTDGVVAIPGEAESGGVISMGNPADRFVMGLLRACAGAVLVGAGTFRRSPKHRWIPEAVCPAGRELFAETRRRLGLSPAPRFVLLTASGAVDPACPALEGALVATTRAGAALLSSRLPKSAELLIQDGPELELASLVARLRADGVATLLTEGGPSVLSRFVAKGLIDELFLTVSPALLGRYPGDDKKALTEGLDLGRVPLELWSVRRAGAHLFLRYAVGRSA